MNTSAVRRPPESRLRQNHLGKTEECQLPINTKIFNMIPKPTVSVIGLGKLGAPLAIAFSARGFSVVGLDLNSQYVEAINEGKVPVVEYQLQEYLDKAKGNITATQDYAKVIQGSDISFLIVPTPSLQEGRFSDEYLKAALKELAAELHKTGKLSHDFVIVSTVSPGTIERSLIPHIEQYSGRQHNQGFRVAYNPEFIALGDVINGLLRPDMVLVGEGSKGIGDRLEEIYKIFCENKPVIARMSIASAEIAKISLNAYVTMKISFANMLANICEQIPGTNVDDITRALGADKRVSPYYLKGGLSFGGPCFPRDGRAFLAFAGEHGIDAELVRATDAINNLQIPGIAKKILENAGQDKLVAVLGLAYKPNTPVIEESPSMKLVDTLLRGGLRVAVYDPLAQENAKAVLGDQVTYLASVKEGLAFASCCVITTQEPEFKQLTEQDMVHSPTVIVDCWRMLGALKESPKVKYIALGQYHDETSV